MLTQGNVGLSSFQNYADSLKEVLKQTMLRQEIIFRKQVYELHRLYSIQKTLMEDLDLTKVGKFDLPETSKDLPLMIFDSSSKNMANPQLANIHSLKRSQRIFSNHPQIHLDLQLPADQYIAHVDMEFPNREDPFFDCLFGFPKSKHSPAGEFIPDPEELKLSLSVGKEPGIRGCRRESITRVSNEDRKCSTPSSFSASHDYPRGEIGWLFSAPFSQSASKSIQRDPAQRIAASSFDLDGHGSYEEHVFINQDTGSDDTGPDYMFTKKIPLVDLACSSEEDSIVDHRSSNAASDVSHEPIAKTYAIEKGEETDVRSSRASTHQVVVQDIYCNQSPALLNDDPVTNSSGINTAQSEIERVDLNLFDCNKVPKTHSISETSESNSNLCVRQSLDDSKFNHELHNQSKEGPAEMDGLIKTAAESLICISLGPPPSYHDCSSKEGSHELEAEETQPQKSFDSFELITLRLKESSGDDDYCATSKPFEENVRGDEFGFKLRRGRRLKDFRKDILPGLAALSRHEICEDVNIFKGVMRSREYRKIRSRMANDVENWRVPVRSKRSRANNIRRGSYR